MAAVFTVHSADTEDRFLGSAFLWDDGEVAVSSVRVIGQASAVRLNDAAVTHTSARSSPPTPAAMWQ